MGAWILKILTGGLFDTIKELGQAYFKKEISEEQFHAEVAKAMAKASSDVETELLKTAASQYKEFQHTVRTTKLVQYCYAATVVATLYTFFWYIWIQPFGAAMWPDSFPILRTGDKLLEWNYLLLAGLFGLAPLVLSSGKDKMGSTLDWVRKRFKD